jgi:hypothetical protein
MVDSWKFDVRSTGDPKIVDGKVEIRLQVDAHGPNEASGALHLMFDKEAAAELSARLAAQLKLPQLR